MHADSKKFMEDIINKVKLVKKENRLEDGSVEIKVADEDIKHILNKKVLRGNVKQRLSDDLQSAGINAQVCVTNDLKVTIPNEILEDKTIKYSELQKVK